MMIIRTFIALALFWTAPLALASDINGFWKHPKEPAWIEISLTDGTGTVVRNDKFPELVGREIIKSLEADTSEDSLWRGQIYVERIGEHKAAEISLPEPNRMEFTVKVGFMSRSVEWIRVDAVPSSADN